MVVHPLETTGPRPTIEMSERPKYTAPMPKQIASNSPLTSKVTKSTFAILFELGKTAEVRILLISA